MPAALSAWINGMGADAQFLAFAEVYTAIERGILDCGVTGADDGFGQRWYEVTDYIVGPLVSFPSNNNVINGTKWDISQQVGAPLWLPTVAHRLNTAKAVFKAEEHGLAHGGTFLAGTESAQGDAAGCHQIHGDVGGQCGPQAREGEGPSTRLRAAINLPVDSVVVPCQGTGKPTGDGN